jgi:hypothetical protein
LATVNPLHVRHPARQALTARSKCIPDPDYKRRDVKTDQQQRLLLVAIALVAFCLISPVRGQDNQCQPTLPPVSSQLPEPVKQRYGKLFKPDFAKLNLTGKSSEDSQDQSKTVVERFNSGSGLRFKMITTNASEEEVVGYTELDPLILNRPQLCRDGELVFVPQGR